MFQILIKNKLFLRLLLLFLFLLSIFFIISPNIDAGITLGGMYREKIKIIKEPAKTNPRIILVGGSNVFFSLSAKKMQNILGLQVINAGLYIGFGIRFYCEDISRYLKNGDIIVVSPEYQNFNIKDYYQGNKELPRMVLFEYKSALNLLNQSQTFNLIEIFPQYLNTCAKNFINNIFYKDKADNITHDMMKGHINEYWDWIYYYNELNPKLELQEQSISVNTIEQEVIDYLIDFKKRMKQKGIVVLFEPASLRKVEYFKYQQFYTRLQKKFNESGLVFLSKIFDCIVDDNVVNGVGYHLFEKGVMDRSTKLAVHIGKYLENNRK